MKKVFLSLLVLQSSLFFSHAATITWTGPSGSNWNNIANWSPGTIPGAADDVVFNVSVTVEMDLIPATNPFIYLINSLLVTANASVILSRTQAGGGTRILQVKSANAVIPGLRIDNGSTLTLNAANTTGTLSYILDLAGAAAVTAQVSGNLYFTGSGAGTGDAHLNIYTGAANYAKLSVKNTGVIKYFPNSGNTLSAPGTYLTMESGSVYEINKNGGSVPAGNWDDNSTILISGATANGGIIFSQNQYGNLEWNTPLMSAVTQMIATFSTVTAISLNHLKITNTNGRELRLKTGAASASPPYDYTVRGHLEITVAGIFVITGINVVNAGAGARLHVMGNLTNAGILKSEGATGTVNDLELNGNLNQDISITGTLSGTQLKFIMNNPAGATLITPIILPGITSDALQLNSGKINTTATRMLTMLDNSGYTGGTSTSFIEGPMKKIGDDTFSFPIGKGGIYAPVKFSPAGIMDIADAFQAEYFRLNPQNSYGASYETPPIDHISYVEYWQLEKIAGNTAIPVNITLTITPYSFAKDLNTLYVTRYNPPDLQWKNNGIALRASGTSSPPYITGNITSAPSNQFGIFTLATSEPEAINPLPINHISFVAQKISCTQVLLTWDLVNYSREDTKFEIQRSANGKDFSNLGIMRGSQTGRSFYFYDDHLVTGLIRYRLKITGAEGWITYSRIVTIVNDAEEIITTSVFPNPVFNNGTVGISSAAAVKINFTVCDVAGKIIRQWNESVMAGFSSLTIRANDLPPGVYIILVNALDTRRVIPFIKR